jgi:hypothetical protein
MFFILIEQSATSTFKTINNVLMIATVANTYNQNLSKHKEEEVWLKLSC